MVNGSQRPVGPAAFDQGPQLLDGPDQQTVSLPRDNQRGPQRGHPGQQQFALDLDPRRPGPGSPLAEKIRPRPLHQARGLQATGHRPHRHRTTVTVDFDLARPARRVRRIGQVDNHLVERLPGLGNDVSVDQAPGPVRERPAGPQNLLQQNMDLGPEQ